MMHKPKNHTNIIILSLEQAHISTAECDSDTSAVWSLVPPIGAV